MRRAPLVMSKYSATRLSCEPRYVRILFGPVLEMNPMDSLTSPVVGIFMNRKKSFLVALFLWSPMEVASSMCIRIPLRCSPPQMYRVGRKGDIRMSSFVDVVSRRRGSSVVAMGPTVALSMKSVCFVVCPAIGGWGVVFPAWDHSVLHPLFCCAWDWRWVLRVAVIFPGCEGSG